MSFRLTDKQRAAGLTQPDIDLTILSLKRMGRMGAAEIERRFGADEVEIKRACARASARQYRRQQRGQWPKIVALYERFMSGATIH